MPRSIAPLCWPPRLHLVCSLFLAEGSKHATLLPLVCGVAQLSALLRDRVDLLPWEVQHRVDDVKDVFVFLCADGEVGEELCHDVTHVLEVLLNATRAHLVASPGATPR